MELSTREIAVVVWVILLAGWGCSKQNLRRTFGRVLEAAVKWKILLSFGVLGAYTAATAAMLHHIGAWDWDLLKETLLWFCFTGVALVVKAIVHDKEQSLWRSTLRDQIKIGVLLTYLISTYVFPLWVELVLLPTLSIVVILNVVAEAEEQYSMAARMTANFLATCGIVGLGLAVHNAVSTFGPQELDLMIRSLLLIPILSVSLTPLLFLFQVITSYEQLWLRLQLGTDKDPTVVKYAKWQLVRHLKMRPRRIKAFLRQHAVDLMRVKSHADVDNVLRGVVRLRKGLSR